jgi:hypothetical protein
MTDHVLFPNRLTGALVARARMRLGMPNREFGPALGASERTALRWSAGRSELTVPQLRTLAAMVYPQDPGLAAELAEATSTTLVALGIAPPPPPPAPVVVAPPRPDPDVLTDAVVCAAADELSAAPSAVRAGLLAAFRRARELGLTIDEVEKSLAGRIAKRAKGASA